MLCCYYFASVFASFLFYNFTFIIRSILYSSFFVEKVISHFNKTLEGSDINLTDNVILFNQQFVYLSGNCGD